ncbi:hypothetical protein QJQ45_019203 [Haematococcus lacustris]|nr:hypothetical protein QJQ45_019203 [Haematococcus lacustris]
MSIKVLLERTRQQLHVGEKTFKPTPNVRNPAMLLEAEEFARHLSAFKQLLEKFERRITTFLTSVPMVGRSNLPRVWEAVEGTNMCEPSPTEITSRHPHRQGPGHQGGGASGGEGGGAGGDFDELLMTDAAEIMRRRVDAIVRPIERWLESLKVVQARMKKLDGLRMQVDARRRRVHARFLAALRGMTASDAATMRAEVASAGSIRYGHAREEAAASEDLDVFPTNMSDMFEDEGEEDDLERQRNREDYAREALRQHRQLEAVAESYREQEQLVFEQLSGLVRDAAYFKSYVAAGMLVVKDTLVATLAGLGPAKRPLPGFSDREAEDEEGAYGRYAALNDLIEDLPPVRPGGTVKQGGRSQPTGLGPFGAMTNSSQIRPTRLTAQPLQASLRYPAHGPAATLSSTPQIGHAHACLLAVLNQCTATHVAADDLSGPEARMAPVPSVARSAAAIPTDRLAMALGAGSGPLPTTQSAGGEFGPKHPQESFAGVGPAFSAMRAEVANT